MSHAKSSRNKKGLNDLTATPFSLCFSQLPAAKRNTPKTGQLGRHLGPSYFERTLVAQSTAVQDVSSISLASAI